MLIKYRHVIRRHSTRLPSDIAFLDATANSSGDRVITYKETSRHQIIELQDTVGIIQHNTMMAEDRPSWQTAHEDDEEEVDENVSASHHVKILSNTGDVLNLYDRPVRYSVFQGRCPLAILRIIQGDHRFQTHFLS